MLAPSLIKNLSAVAKSVFSVTGKLAATPDNPDPSPKKEPLNEPLKNVSFIDDEICWFVPTFNWESSAALPDTIIFFQVAILLNYFLLYILYPIEKFAPAKHYSTFYGGGCSWVG